MNIIDELLGQAIFGTSDDTRFKGYFATPAALIAAYPTATDGSYAIIGTTDTVWIWDSDTSSWTDSGVHGAVTSVFGRTSAVTAANGDYTASQVTNVPAGNISSITVQAAINELDSEKVVANASIIPETKTKITYDAKGLVTAGADATTADISASTNKNYVTDAELVIITSTSGHNTGDVTLASPDNGLSLTGQILALGTPSTITNATTNSVTTTSHTHAVLGLEPTVSKGNLSVSDPITISAGSGTNAVIGAGLTLAHSTSTGYLHLPTAGSANQILKNSSVSGTGAWGTVTENAGALAAITTLNLSGQLTSTLTTGSAPLVIASATKVSTLNVDQVDSADLSIDGLFSANSDVLIPSQKAAKTYVDTGLATKQASLPAGTTTTVLHGNPSGPPSYSSVVETDISLSNNTTNDVSTAKHGFAPILPNLATYFLNGTGAWSTPTASTVPNAYVSSTFTSQTSVSLTHNYGAYPLVQILSSTGAVLIPLTVTHTSLNAFTVTFDVATSGTIIATLGAPQLNNYVTSAVSYLSTANDYIIKETGSGTTVSLTSSSELLGKILVIKNASLGDITLSSNNGKTIDGSSFATLSSLDSATVFYDGSNWNII